MTAFRRTYRLLAAAGSFAIVITGAAWAQEETVYIGGTAPRGGTVQVDMSVLDDFGGPVHGQGLLSPPGQSNNVQRIVLTPPGQKKAPKASTQRRTTKAKSVTPRKAPAPTSKAKAPSTKIASAMPSPTPAPAPKAAPLSADLQPPPADIASQANTAPAVAARKTAEPARAAAPRDIKPAASKPPAMATVETPAASPAVETAPAAPPPSAPPATISSEAKAIPASAALPAANRAPERSPQPAPAAAAPSQPAPSAQTASLTPATQGSVGGQSMRIAFAGAAAALPDSAKSDLKQIAGQLSKDAAMRVQVMAYASGSDDASKARRLSLSRALAVRTYLIEQGIGSTRIDVRALGNSAQDGPADRVDLTVVSR